MQCNAADTHPQFCGINARNCGFDGVAENPLMGRNIFSESPVPLSLMIPPPTVFFALVPPFDMWIRPDSQVIVLCSLQGNHVITGRTENPRYVGARHGRGCCYQWCGIRTPYLCH